MDAASQALQAGRGILRTARAYWRGMAGIARQVLCGMGWALQAGPGIAGRGGTRSIWAGGGVEWQVRIGVVGHVEARSVSDRQSRCVQERRDKFWPVAGVARIGNAMQACNGESRMARNEVEGNVKAGRGMAGEERHVRVQPGWDGHGLYQHGKAGGARSVLSGHVLVSSGEVRQARLVRRGP